MKSLLRSSLAAIILAASFMTLATGAEAWVNSSRTTSIGNDRGGKIIHYALKAAKLRRAGKQVRISGSCDSACTLYLSLPTRQLCLTRGAAFRFHSPQARSQRSVRMARNFLMAKYPGWVRSYIRSQGGIYTSRLITMRYSYASRFIKTCSATSRIASR